MSAVGNQKTIPLALAAQYLGMSTQGVLHLIKVKRLKPVRVGVRARGKGYLLDPREVVAYQRLRQAGACGRRAKRGTARWYQSADVTPV